MNIPLLHITSSTLRGALPLIMPRSPHHVVAEHFISSRMMSSLARVSVEIILATAIRSSHPLLFKYFFERTN